jgi:DNA repair protein RecO
MHNIYNTEAFVLSSFPFGEAGKVLTLLTKDLGVIRVNAPGTRKTESKLRQSIQDFCYSRVTMVLGKAGWRLTNAAIEENYYHQFGPMTNKMVSRVFSLVERMIPDEETNSVIFDLIIKMFEFMKSREEDLESNPKISRNIEIITVVKILHELGYVGDEKGLHQLLKGDFKKLYSEVDGKNEFFIKIINNAIRESHL